MAYNCYANPNPIYQPAMRLITAITQAKQGVVTTSFAHQYPSGLIVRLDIPIACGMQQINGQVVTITVLSPTTFSINLDTTLFAPFSIPVGSGPHVNICAQVVPIGEVNEILYGATNNSLNPT